jgi:hypothetical protein
MLNFKIIIFTLFIVSPIISINNVLLPIGWRFPTINELSDDSLRMKSSNKYIKAIADFNCDNILDEAYLLISIKSNSEGLFVRLSINKNEFKWIMLDSINRNDNYLIKLSMGIDTVAPGRYPTACGKGYWECNKNENEPETLFIKNVALDYFLFESANSFYYWDKNIGSFKRIWISD